MQNIIIISYTLIIVGDWLTDFELLLSGKTLKCTIYHPGALINRTSGFSFPKVSPPNQTGSVLEAIPLRFEPSLPNPFQGLQEMYSSLHNT